MSISKLLFLVSGQETIEHMRALCPCFTAPLNPKNLYQSSAKPNIENKLNDLEANIGKPARLETVVTGFPAPEVVWLKDSHEIEFSERVVQEGRGNTKILHIKKSLQEDIGTYTIKATNEAGEDSCSCNLGVKGDIFLKNVLL